MTTRLLPGHRSTIAAPARESAAGINRAIRMVCPALGLVMVTQVV